MSFERGRKKETELTMCTFWTGTAEASVLGRRIVKTIARAVSSFKRVKCAIDGEERIQRYVPPMKIIIFPSKEKK